MRTDYSSRFGFALLWGSLIFTVAAQLDFAQSQPSAFDENAVNAPIRDMHLMTASTGWALAGEHVVWTSTAGQSWSEISPPLSGGQVIDTVYFLDSDHGWAVLHAGEDLPTISIAITTDGGKSWSIVPFPADAFVLQGYAYGGYLSFVDDQRGWMLLK